MLGVLYLILCMAFGVSLIRILVPDMRGFYGEIASTPKLDFLPNLVFTIPAGFIIGVLSTSMFSYYLTLTMAKGKGSPDMIRALGMSITFAVFILWTAMNILIMTKDLRRRSKPGMKKLPAFRDAKYRKTWKSNCFYAITIGIMILLVSFLMLDSFRSGGGKILAGNSAVSDLAPGVALTSSFGKGFNFPTQFPHYAADGIQYHFFFYYFCGNLEFLGLPIDWAINLPSIFSMVSTLMLVGTLGVLLSKKRGAFALVPALVLLRSSFNSIMQFSEYFSQYHSFSRTLKEMLAAASYYGKTPNEGSGVWTINIFAGQRHLMFGMACAVLLIMLFAPYVRSMCSMLGNKKMRGKRRRTFFFGRYSWLPERTGTNGPWRTLVLAIIIVLPFPFFHGSELISTLLILAFMAIFSTYRLIYVLTGGIAVLSALFQARLFSGTAEKIFRFQVHIGFVSESKSPLAMLSYLVAVTGLTLILAAIYIFFVIRKDRRNRGFQTVLGVAFLLPMVFAFIFQTTSNLMTNHKFVQTTILLMDVFVACLLLRLWHGRASGKTRKQAAETRRRAPRLLACVLFILLTVSSVFEWKTYDNCNETKKEIDPRSEMVAWISGNVEPDAVFLTPCWNYATFYLAGRSAYCGDYYYAWSAGHNVSGRLKKYCDLVSGCGGNIKAFRKLCYEEGISYVIVSPDYRYPNLPGAYSYVYDPAFFEENLVAVARCPNDNVVIYSV